MLPKLDKKVLYLDQHALSEIFKVKSKTRRAGAPLEDFWILAADKIERAVMLQQLVVPMSSIHGEETLVFSSANELRIAHELFGDVRLSSWRQIQDDQELDLFEAFLHEGVPPIPSRCVDAILESDRNTWLSRLHITVDEGPSPFATLFRAEREQKGKELESLWKNWVENNLGFNEVLEIEFANLATINEERLKKEYRFQLLVDEMCRLAVRSGRNQQECLDSVLKFWRSPYMREVPTHKISSYLFAALARRANSGQKRVPSGGFLNDVSWISAYAPFVDSMFLDKECFELLMEVEKNLPIKAKMFSVEKKEEFLSYLDEISFGADPQVAKAARNFYGMN